MALNRKKTLKIVVVIVKVERKKQTKEKENKFPPISLNNKESKYITLNDDSATYFSWEKKREGKKFPRFVVRVTRKDFLHPPATSFQPFL
jgi:predicted secreted protein